MKKHILLLIMLIIIPMVMANPVIDWLTPNQNGEVIEGYPQTIRYVTRDNFTITNCTVNVSTYTYTINISNNKTEVQINTKLTENNYTVSIQCQNSINSTTESRTIIINDLINFQKQNKEDKQLTLYIIIIVILTIIYFSIKQELYKLLISTTLLFASIIIYTQLKETLLIIPIIITTIMTLQSIIKNLFK